MKSAVGLVEETDYKRRGKLHVLGVMGKNELDFVAVPGLNPVFSEFLPVYMWIHIAFSFGF
jgi:hypothetical protein